MLQLGIWQEVCVIHNFTLKHSRYKNTDIAINVKLTVCPATKSVMSPALNVDLRPIKWLLCAGFVVDKIKVFI